LRPTKSLSAPKVIYILLIFHIHTAYIQRIYTKIFSFNKVKFLFHDNVSCLTKDIIITYRPVYILYSVYIIYIMYTIIIYININSNQERNSTREEFNLIKNYIKNKK